jgi:hypothetical protein
VDESLARLRLSNLDVVPVDGGRDDSWNSRVAAIPVNDQLPPAERKATYSASNEYTLGFKEDSHAEAALHLQLSKLPVQQLQPGVITDHVGNLSVRPQQEAQFVRDGSKT